MKYCWLGNFRLYKSSRICDFSRSLEFASFNLKNPSIDPTTIIIAGRSIEIFFWLGGRFANNSINVGSHSENFVKAE